MKKTWAIALKDTLIRFRDRNGILLMLVAPLVLAAITGAAFGGLTSSGGSASPITGIPIILVNADQGDFGQAVVDALFSPDLAELVDPVEMADLDEARAKVEAGGARAVLSIPADFSATVQSTGAETTAFTLYTDPTASFSPVIVRAIVERIATDFNAGILGGRVAAAQLLERQQTLGPALAQLPAVLSQTLSENGGSGEEAVSLQAQTVGGDEEGNPNPLAYFAPSMAILFLMFTIFEASRSFLEEEREGTLQRMMSTPTGFGQILAGKIGGVFFTGVLQLGILVLASALLFRLDWGRSLLGLVLMIVAVVAAAGSLGAFITAIARDASQAAVIGSAVALIFAILGGNFVVAEAYPAWLQPLSKLTINRWAIDGFTDLSLRGGGLADVLPEVAVLLAMAAALFALAMWRLPRRFVR